MEGSSLVPSDNWKLPEKERIKLTKDLTVNDFVKLDAAMERTHVAILLQVVRDVAKRTSNYDLRRALHQYDRAHERD